MTYFIIKSDTGWYVARHGWTLNRAEARTFTRHAAANRIFTMGRNDLQVEAR